MVHRVPTRLDSLSTACYTVPWKPRKKPRRSVAAATSSVDVPFPILEGVEQRPEAARARYSGYLDSMRSLDRLFETCVGKIYAPLFSDLKAFLDRSNDAEDQLPGSTATELFIPGFDAPANGSSLKADTSALRTAFLISASTPAFSSLSHRLVSYISTPESSDGDRHPTITVTLDQSECPNVNTAIHLLVARFVAQTATSLDVQGDDDGFDAGFARLESAAASSRSDADLRTLITWYIKRFATYPGRQGEPMASTRRPSLVLHLPSIEAIEPSVLSDLLMSLQAFSAGLDEALASHGALDSTGSTLVLILGISSPSGAAPGPSRQASSFAVAPAPWSTYIPRTTLERMNFSRFALPSKEGVWMELVRNFLTSRHLPIAIGRKTFEFIRQTYWERDANLDLVLDAMRLAVFDHFSSNPLSAFAGWSAMERTIAALDPGYWTSKMLQTLRLAILDSEVDDGLWLPGVRPGQADAAGPKEHVQRLLSDDAFLVEQVAALKLQRDILAYRLEVMIRFLAHGFKCLHRLDSAGLAHRAASSNDALLQQREAELTSSMMTLVVAQCLQASVGSLDEGHRPTPTVLSLTNGLTKLCTAAKRLPIPDFEALIDDFVLFMEREVAEIEAAYEEAELLGAEDAVGDEALTDPFRASALEEMQGLLAALRTFQQRLAQLIVSAGKDLDGRSTDHLDDEQALNDLATENASTVNPKARARIEALMREQEQRRQERILRVQKRLETEEKVVGLKREVTNWIAAQVQAWLDWDSLTEGQTGPNGVVGLIKDIWWHDSFDSISALLDACPRSGLLQPLNDPHAFLEQLDALAADASQGERGVAVVPDICRAYQLYRDCGKNVNLADWFEAFRQSLENDVDPLVVAAPHQPGKSPLKRPASVGVNPQKRKVPRRSDMGAHIAPKSTSGLVAMDLDEDREGQDGRGKGDDNKGQNDGEDGLMKTTPSTGRQGRSVLSARAATRRPRVEFDDESGSDDEDVDDDHDYDDVLDTPSRRKSARAQWAARLQDRNQLTPGALRLHGRSDASTADAQARFALVINELARMGLLRGTRRKNEHVIKVVWDLVPE